MSGKSLHDTARGGLVLALLTAAIGSATPQPAHADGVSAVGGSCCADLEERVAELEATTARKGNRRVSLTVSGQVTRQLMYWNDGEQNDVYSVDNGANTSRFRFTGDAKISPEYQAGFIIELDIRIGARSNLVSQVDDDGVSGAGGILGTAAFGDGIGAAGDAVPGIRQAAWWIESRTLGRVTIGRLNAATYGIATIDVSNTGIIADSEPGEFMGGFLLRNGRGILSTNNWSQTCGGPTPVTPAPGAGGFYFNDCWEHGPVRRDAIRYDTPTFWGFTAATSFGEDDYYDAALRYAGEFAGFRVAGGVGYRVFRDREFDLPFPIVGPIDRFADTDRRQFLTSLSVMHLPTGLFASGAYVDYQFFGSNSFERIFGGARDDHRPDIPLWWFDAGIQKNWTGWGATTFYGEWGRFDDGTTGLLASVAYPGLGPVGAAGGFIGSPIVVNSEVQWWGAGIVQRVDAAAMDLFIAYRQYQTHVTIDGGPANQIPGGLNDIWFIQAGGRVQF